MLPKESDQLRLYRHSAISPLGYIATRPQCPEPSSSSLTSSSTQHMPRCLRGQISSGYIATRLHRHSATSPLGYITTRPQRQEPSSSSLTSSSTQHRPRCLRSQISSGYIATRPQLPEPSSSSLTSSSTQHRPRCLRSQISSGYIATRLHRHSATSPLG